MIDIDELYNPELDDGETDSLAFCKFCRRGPYEWMKVDGKWRLYTITGRLHKCSAWKVSNSAEVRASND